MTKAYHDQRQSTFSKISQSSQRLKTAVCNNPFKGRITPVASTVRHFCFWSRSLAKAKAKLCVYCTVVLPLYKNPCKNKSKTVVLLDNWNTGQLPLSYNNFAFVQESLQKQKGELQIHRLSFPFL
jgi:hypothetical protein